ncbi:hypothetical protein ACFZB6_24395 [Streptomyces syringium]|uniref:hypothetical protein n=1 Tax=Streptomyces syringium TaxID=76729 RepID=UPI0033A1CF4E
MREVLNEAGRRGTGEVFRFAEVAGVHFARLLLVPEGPDSTGALLPPCVAHMSEVDGPVSVHPADLVRSAGDEPDKVFANCRVRMPPG